MKHRIFPALVLVCVIALGACQNFSGIATQVASDVGLIATAFQAALPNFAKIVGISPTQLATINADVTDLVQVSGEIAKVAGDNQAQPLVQRVEGDVNGIVGVLAGLPLPAPISTALEAAGVLLPVIEAAVGLVVTPPTATALYAAHSHMTPDQARAVLEGLR